MKRMKKILAMLLALTMVLGMSLTVMAETSAETSTIPDGTQKKEVTVSGIEKNAIVKAYQIVEGVYNENGLVDYVVVKDKDGKPLVNILNAKAPTSDEVTEIAREKLEVLGTPETLQAKDSAAEATHADYVANLTAGYWVVVVTAVTGDDAVLTEVYNPILVGVWYSKSGSDLDMAFGPVSADDDWDLVTENAYAKHSPLTITKAVNDKAAEVKDVNVADTVTFTVKTSIPSYSKQYSKTTEDTSVLYTIKDEIRNGLKYNKDLKVVVGNQQLTKDTHYTVNYVEAAEATDTTAAVNASFEIKFDNDYVLDLAGTMTDRAVLLTYSATVTPDADVNDPAHNVVSVTYETEPGKVNTKSDEEYVYTFTIDGIIKKVKDDKDKSALGGAEFTLYKKFENNVVSEVFKTALSGNDDGDIVFTDLDADKEYWLKETKAPTEYSLNDNIYKIKVSDVKYDVTTKKLTSWTIIVTPMTKKADGTYIDGTAKNYEYTVNQKGTIDLADSAVVTTIVNTKLNALPSTGGIGTTIFTVAGCGIMIAAAFFFIASRKKEN